MYVADLTEELVTSSSQVLAWIRKGESKNQQLSPDASMRLPLTPLTFLKLLRKPPLWEDEDEPEEQPLAHHISDGKICICQFMGTQENSIIKMFLFICSDPGES